MAKQKITTIGKLIPDKKNANLHSEHGTDLLRKSLFENGFGRSILISADNEIIAGNGVTDTALKNGKHAANVRIIETDGTELIAVKRTDIKSGSPEFYAMALADNIVSKENIVISSKVVESIATEFTTVRPWAEQIKPLKTESPNISHEKRGSITLHFLPDDLATVKDYIQNSGLTAEKCVLEAFAAKKPK